jgi:hypothetical protein
MKDMFALGSFDEVVNVTMNHALGYATLTPTENFEDQGSDNWTAHSNVYDGDEIDPTYAPTWRMPDSFRLVGDWEFVQIGQGASPTISPFSPTSLCGSRFQWFGQEMYETPNTSFAEVYWGSNRKPGDHPFTWSQWRLTFLPSEDQDYVSLWMDLRVVYQDPLDADPTKRPSGIVGEYVDYRGTNYVCLDQDTPSGLRRTRITVG